MMPADMLAAIRAREAAATPGPWQEGILDGVVVMSPGPGFSNRIIAECRILSERHLRADEWRANAPFIAHARQDIPALLTEVDRLRAGIAGLRREHEQVCYWPDAMSTCGVEHGRCECGVEEWNAKIDALLKGDI